MLCREVKEGTSQTLYPMDPERELENLRRNWATFKRDFKVTCVAEKGCRPHLTEWA